MTAFRADLHCHSTCSDGSLAPKELLALAKQIGLSALSITDHDTIEAYETAIPLSAEIGVQLLPGVEFSTVFNGTSIHILGYNYDPKNPDISAFCNRHLERRRHRNSDILDLLNKHGMPVSEEELQAAAPLTFKAGQRVIGRPHIAMAMMQKGYVTSVQEAFRKYIGDGRPCFSQGASFTVEETLEVIHRANGIAIIAHPHLINQAAIVNALIEMDFDGIECYYGNFSQSDHKQWLKIAQRKEWLITGGSDFHGDIKPAINLGCSWIGSNEFETLLNFKR